MSVKRLVSFGVSAVLAALSFAPPAFAETVVPAAATLPSKLTLPVAVSMFRERGLDLLLSDVAVQSARADRRTAGAITNPTLTAGVGKSFGDPCSGQGTGCSSVAFQAGLADNAAITDILFGKRYLRTRVADLAVESAKMDRLDAQRVLELPVKQEFVQAALSKASLELAKEVQETSTKTLELIEVRFKAGAVSEADVARIETAKLEADQAVDLARESLRAAKVGLAVLLGARALVPEYDVDDGFVHQRITESLGEDSRESLLHEALEHRPDLKSIELLQKHAEASISLEKRLRVPDIGVWAQYAQEGVSPGAISPPTLTLGISTPLPIFYQNQGAILKAEADRLTQSLQRAKLEAQIVNNVEISLNAYAFSQRRLSRMESALLQRARRARELVGIQYEKGAASLIELLDAQRTLIATNVEYLQDLTDYWTAVFQIEQAVGRELHR